MATHSIELTLLGVFYQRPAPDQPPFKSPGDPVVAGETIGLVEVMKSFLSIEADHNGVFGRYLLADQSDVDVGDAACEIEV